jgi:hypothetical protein
MQMCKLCIISTIIGTADGIAGGIVRITAAGIVRITAAGIAPITAALITTGMARITGAGIAPITAALITTARITGAGMMMTNPRPRYRRGIYFVF